MAESIIAADLFSIGDAVEATEDCLSQGLTGKDKKSLGEVTGFSKDKTLVCVRVFGHRTSNAYDPKYWRKAFTDRRRDG